MSRRGCLVEAAAQSLPYPGASAARCLAWKRPGLPTQWTRVLERNPEAMRPDPLPGYVWLETPGKVLHVPAAALEFREGEGGSVSPGA